MKKTNRQRGSSLALFLILASLVTSAQVLAEEPKPAQIGEVISNLTFKDIRSVTRDLNDLGEAKGYVFFFATTKCPLVAKNFPKVKELYDRYHEQNVVFVAVNTGADDTIREVAAQAIDYQIPFYFVKDYDLACAKRLGVERTPTAIVLNEKKELVYRGRVDDQHRIGGTKPKASRADLEEAIQSTLKGERPLVSETSVDGCVLTESSRSQTSELTYYQHVAPIIAKKCANCHREGAATPFNLTSYEDVVANAEMVVEVIRDETMPPWYASKKHGIFQNDPSLTDEEKRTVADWVSSGRKEGAKPTEEPTAQTPASKWRIGEPDLVITMAEEHTVPATGFVPYRYTVLPHIFLGETWVEAVEIRPENAAVVHHCNMAYVTKDGASEETFITGYVPGGQPLDLSRFGEGIAYRIPAGAGLGLQIHYTTTGKEETCRIQVAFRYAKSKVKQELRHFLLDPRGWRIPAGDPAFEIRSERQLDRDVNLLGLFTHMHVRGRDMTFYAESPTGERQTLLQIPNYNFEWQLGYELKPGTKILPKGTKVEAIAHFDNSPFNPYNPDPKIEVRYGPQTVDEMFNGFVFYVAEGEDLDIEVNPKNGKARPKKKEGTPDKN